MQTIARVHLSVYKVQCAAAYTHVCMYVYTEHKFLTNYLLNPKVSFCRTYFYLSDKALQGLTGSKNNTQDPNYEVNICLTKTNISWPKETGQV
jgi:hypothetical protein